AKIGPELRDQYVLACRPTRASAARQVTQDQSKITLAEKTVPLAPERQARVLRPAAEYVRNQDHESLVGNLLNRRQSRVLEISSPCFWSAPPKHSCLPPPVYRPDRGPGAAA